MFNKAPINLNQIAVSAKDLIQSSEFHEKLGLMLIVKSFPDNKGNRYDVKHDNK